MRTRSLFHANLRAAPPHWIPLVLMGPLTACAPSPRSTTAPEPTLAACASGAPYAPPAGVPTVPFSFRARIEFSEWFELDRVCVFLDGAPLFGVATDPDHREATGRKFDWATRIVPGAHAVTMVVRIDQAQEPDGSPGAGHGRIVGAQVFEAARDEGIAVVATGHEKPGRGSREARAVLSWSVAPTLRAIPGEPDDARRP